LILKIFFKNKKYYLNKFSNKKYFKKPHYTLARARALS